MWKPLLLTGEKRLYHAVLSTAALIGTDGTRRTVAESGSSLKVTIPSQLAHICGVAKGDSTKFEYPGPTNRYAITEPASDSQLP